jgi:L-lactate dehydrogenase complex protein LldF
MTEQQSVFLAKSEVKAHDLEHKRKLGFNIDKYNDAAVKSILISHAKKQKI